MSKASEERDPLYPVVNAHNEWDPLEEIIVGIVEGAMIPPWDVIMEATLHGADLWEQNHRKFFRSGCHRPVTKVSYPADHPAAPSRHEPVADTVHGQ